MEEVTVAVRGTSLNVLVTGPADGTPVLLVHGNCSSADFWRPLLRRLPPTLRIVAPDLRGYGRSATAPVDATRGLRDFADDVAAVLDALFPAGEAVTVVAHSMGCGVAMQLLVDHPTRVSALMLEAPVSPYGFGGTRDLDGTPTTPDFAGTGGGTANPDFVRRLAAGDRDDDGPTSPLSVLRTAYVADPASLGSPSEEQLLLDTVLSTAIGDDNYPGDSKPSANWPGMAPGDRGVLNTMAPNHFNVAADLVALAAKPPITWVRGDKDAIVSDTSFFDLAYLGSLGVVPGWPGAAECPPQPMVSQTRAVLERYTAAGGTYTEMVYEDCGHSPHVERPAEFAAELLKLL